MDYLKEHGREPKACFTSDDDAVFEQVYDIDLSTIQPIVAKPHFVDNVVPAKESLGVKIDEAFLGSCNNGRIEDLRVGAAIIKGKKVAPTVRFLVVPASRSVYLQAMTEGLLDIFLSYTTMHLQRLEGNNENSLLQKQNSELLTLNSR